MITKTIAQQRLHDQGLLESPFATPEEVVSWFGAVQAQDYYGAQWSLALRMGPTTDATIEQALDEGRILRTHIMRPTWHFVLPQDIRWIQTLTAARVHTVNAYMYRQVGLDNTLMARCIDRIAAMLQGFAFLTRAEIGAKLAEVGITAEGLLLTHIMMVAELESVVCSGPRRGKQFTYALLDERASQGIQFEGDEALSELMKRYFTGHGPATLHDFAWWSGLTVTEARRGVEMAAEHLDCTEIDGEVYWFAKDQPPPGESPLSVVLLPTFDEYFVGYTGFGEAVNGGRPAPKNMVSESPILICGEVAGTWRRTLKKREVTVELTPYRPFTAQEHTAVHAAAESYAAFLGLAVNCVVL